MSEELKSGSRWISAADGTEVIVVKPGEGELVLECGGHPMLPFGSERDPGVSVDPAFAGGTTVGRRYEHSSGLELLCVKAGTGSLAIGGEVLGFKQGRPLPSSD